MREHLEELKLGGRPMTKLEKANKEIKRLNNIIDKAIEYIETELNQVCPRDFDGLVYGEDILSILRGEDKE